MSIAISAPTQYSVTQRSSATQGTFAIAGTYAFGSACHIEASTDNFVTSTRIATLSSSGGASFTGNFLVNAGHRVTLSIRFEEDHAQVATVTNVAVGERVYIFGDSRTQPLYATAFSYTATTIGCSQLDNDGVTWRDANNASALRNTWVIRYCDLLCQQLDMAVGCTIQNAGGTDIGTADRWSTTVLDLWTTVEARLGSEAWGHVLGEFGPNAFAYHVTQATYRDDCKLQTDFITLHVPGAPTKIFWQLCGQGNNEGTGSWKDNVRGGILAHVALNVNGYVGAVIINQGYESGTQGENDGVHPRSDTHANEIANGYFLGVQGVVSGTGSAVRGPRVFNITNSGVNVDIIFDQTLGNAIAATLTATAFAVTDNGSPATISSATVLNTTTVRLVLSGAPTGTLLVSMGKGDTAVLATLPKSANRNLPDATTAVQLAEPFYDMPLGTGLVYNGRLVVQRA